MDVNEEGNRVLHDLPHFMLYFLTHAMHEGIEHITYSSWQMQMISSSVTVEEDSKVHAQRKKKKQSKPNRYFERAMAPSTIKLCQSISRCI